MANPAEASTPGEEQAAAELPTDTAATDEPKQTLQPNGAAATSEEPVETPQQNGTAAPEDVKVETKLPESSAMGRYICIILSTYNCGSTPNLKLACFVCYIKIINTFSKNNACIFKWIIQGSQKWHWNFSRPSSFKVTDQTSQNNVLINNSRNGWST